MSDAEEVRAMEIATKLVLGPLCWAATGWLNEIGLAIAELAKQFDSVDEIRAVGDLLETLTDRDRKAIARGERWGKRSGALSEEEARKVLLGMTIAQAKAFCHRWAYGHAEVMDWAMGYSDIHGGALVALGDAEEMAKITGETR